MCLKKNLEALCFDRIPDSVAGGGPIGLAQRRGLISAQAFDQPNAGG